MFQFVSVWVRCHQVTKLGEFMNLDSQWFSGSSLRKMLMVVSQIGKGQGSGGSVATNWFSETNMTPSNVANVLLQNGNPISTSVYVRQGFGPCTLSFSFCSNLCFTASQGWDDQFVADVIFRGETILYQNLEPHQIEPTKRVPRVSGVIWRGIFLIDWNQYGNG